MTARGKASTLPDDWVKRLSKVPKGVKARDVDAALGLSNNEVYYHRVGNQELDNIFIDKVKNSKAVFRSARSKSKIYDDCVDIRTPMPLIDKENLLMETRMAVLSISTLQAHSVQHDLPLHTVRRWGALLALAHEVVKELKEELRRERTRSHDAKVALHNAKRGGPAAVHANGGVPTDIV